MTTPTLTLHLRRVVLDKNPADQSIWRAQEWPKQTLAASCALILCDVWDKHWSQGAVDRLDAMLPAMEQVVQSARSQGVHIIHAPSETMDFYAEMPARQRILTIPSVTPPPDRDMPTPPLPVDASDGGSDTGEADWHKAWSRQHPAISVDQERDVISDSGPEIYSYLHHRQIRQVLIMGVHTNMCILNRSFAIKQMVRWGVQIALVRDLTDTMYNPAMAPYVSHDAGTQLVIGYIERFWCPTVESRDLAGG